LAELGISKNLSSQAQKLAAIPSETFEAKLAAGERRRFAFIRTKEKTIKDPLGAFRPRLAAAAKEPRGALRRCARSNRFTGPGANVLRL
jgi:hypothetical protein